MMNKYLMMSMLLCSSSLTWAESSHKSNATVSEVKILQDAPLRWMRSPRVSLLDGDLEGKPRKVVVDIQADQTGKITNVKIKTSSGLPDLDDLVIQAVKKARFHPYIENGVSYPVEVTQPFEFKSNNYASTKKTIKRIAQTMCLYNFKTMGFQQQQQGQHIPFQYREAPVLKLYLSELNTKDIEIRLNFNLNRKNIISDIYLTQSSGNPTLDAKILTAFSAVKIEAPRKFYQISKYKFEEQIALKDFQCN